MAGFEVLCGKPMLLRSPLGLQTFLSGRSFDPVYTLIRKIILFAPTTLAGWFNPGKATFVIYGDALGSGYTSRRMSEEEEWGGCSPCLEREQDFPGPAARIA